MEKDIYSPTGIPLADNSTLAMATQIASCKKGAFCSAAALFVLRQHFAITQCWPENRRSALGKPEKSQDTV